MGLSQVAQERVAVLLSFLPRIWLRWRLRMVLSSPRTFKFIYEPVSVTNLDPEILSDP